MSSGFCSVPSGRRVHLVRKHGEVEEVLCPVDGRLAIMPGSVPGDVVPSRGHPHSVAPHAGAARHLGVLLGDEAVVHVRKVLRIVIKIFYELVNISKITS